MMYTCNSALLLMCKLELLKKVVPFLALFLLLPCCRPRSSLFWFTRVEVVCIPSSCSYSYHTPYQLRSSMPESCPSQVGRQNPFACCRRQCQSSKRQRSRLCGACISCRAKQWKKCSSVPFAGQNPNRCPSWGSCSCCQSSREVTNYELALLIRLLECGRKIVL